MSEQINNLYDDIHNALVAARFMYYGHSDYDLKLALNGVLNKLEAARWGLDNEVMPQLKKLEQQRIARCTVPPGGWICTRTPGHDGPCAAHPEGHKDTLTG